MELQNGPVPFHDVGVFSPLILSDFFPTSPKKLVEHVLFIGGILLLVIHHVEVCVRNTFKLPAV